MELGIAIRDDDFRACPHRTDGAFLEGSEHVIELVVILRVVVERFDGNG
jgi:hypothetical protein